MNGKKCVSSADTGEARTHTCHTLHPPTGCPIDTISPTTDRMSIGRKRTSKRTDEKKTHGKMCIYAESEIYIPTRTT